MSCQPKTPYIGHKLFWILDLLEECNTNKVTFGFCLRYYLNVVRRADANPLRKSDFGCPNFLNTLHNCLASHILCESFRPILPADK